MKGSGIMNIFHNGSFEIIRDPEDAIRFIADEFNPELAGYLSQALEAHDIDEEDKQIAAESDAVMSVQESFENDLRDIAEEVKEIQKLIDGRLNRAALQKYINNINRIIRNAGI